MINVPKFASETQEAEWWCENRELHAEDFAKAFEQGRVRRGSGIVHYLAQLEKARKLLANQDDAARLAKLAFKKGIDVEDYLHELVHNAILQEMESAA